MRSSENCVDVSGLAFELGRLKLREFFILIAIFTLGYSLISYFSFSKRLKFNSH